MSRFNANEMRAGLRLPSANETRSDRWTTLTLPSQSASVSWTTIPCKSCLCAVRCASSLSSLLSAQLPHLTAPLCSLPPRRLSSASLRDANRHPLLWALTRSLSHPSPPVSKEPDPPHRSTDASTTHLPRPKERPNRLAGCSTGSKSAKTELTVSYVHPFPTDRLTDRPADRLTDWFVARASRALHTA